MQELISTQRQEINVTKTINNDTFYNFISYLDASQKTVETYNKALRQFFNYLSLNNIREPQKRLSNKQTS